MSYVISPALRAVLRELDELANVRSVSYNTHYTGEAVNGIESRTADRSRFPETVGRLRVHEREVS